MRKSRKGGRHHRSVCLLPVLLDSELALAGAGGGRSVLGLPLGTGSVLSRLLVGLSGHRQRKVLVVSSGDPARLSQRLAPAEQAAFRVVRPTELVDAILACETSDYLMIVKPAFWPSTGYDFGALARQGAQFRGATHAIALAPSASAAREQIVCDAEGRVRRIHRLYDAMSWPEAASSRIICSLVPSHVLDGEDLCHPALLRKRLASQGVLMQDIPITSDVHDLTQPTGILSLSEQVVRAVVRRSPAEGYEFHSERVLVGSDCDVHPTARLVGPVVIQRGVVVEEGARIVGPAVVGAESRICRGATVTGALIGFGTIVAPGAAVTQEVRLGNDSVMPRGGSTSSQGAACESSFVLRTSGQDKNRVISVTEPDRWRSFQLGVKRGIDITGALVGLTLLSPLMAVVALFIKLTSPGPVFFVHQRERRGGVEFPCIKFRSMVADAHLRQRELYEHNQMDGPQFKLDDDPRETRIGRWMRRLNIDELPQLINVLLGHMSLVGPRPSPFRENQICVSWRQARLSVRPGITGLWQLCRDRRSDGDFHQWIYYDLVYVRHFSVWLDIKILLSTVLTLGGRRRVSLSFLTGIPEEGAIRADRHREKGASGEGREGSVASAVVSGPPRP